jgi:hypothetical protein
MNRFQKLLVLLLLYVVTAAEITDVQPTPNSSEANLPAAGTTHIFD